MATARDELFCKFAIQNGAWTREEAVLFIQHYRATGDEMRFGDWAANQGAIDATLATRIENTIDQRLAGESTVVRQKPRATASAATPARKAKGGAVSARVSKRARRGSGGLGIDFQRNPVQSSIYLGSGILAIIAVFYILFQLQKSDPPPPVQTDKNKATDSTPTGTGSTTTENVQQTPSFSPEEIKNMGNRIQITITDARGYLRDGKSSIGLRQLRKVREEMGGDLLPAELLGRIDNEISELLTIIEEIYAESLEELRTAKAADNAEEVQDILTEIEQMCGPDYRARAEKEGS